MWHCRKIPTLCIDICLFSLNIPSLYFRWQSYVDTEKMRPISMELKHLWLAVASCWNLLCTDPSFAHNDKQTISYVRTTIMLQEGTALQHHLSGTLSLSPFRTVTRLHYLNLDLKHICSPPSMLLNCTVCQHLWSHGNVALYKFCIVLYSLV